MNYFEDTICAIATAQGGAIGIVRVSGPQAVTATQQIFRPSHQGRQLSDAKPYTLTFGCIMDGEEVVDEVLVSLFRAPHSYTGEDSTEIACHGSAYVLQRVVMLLLQQGCRLAGPGEFTQRAYFNGKMDLCQAEAVADLIASTSEASHKLAINQMRGGLSRELQHLRDRLLHFTSLIELELDFSDHEDIEFADRTELFAMADHIEQVICRLVNSFKVGNAIKNGVPVVIIGDTNVGKSTLLNALIEEERAIVSDISGTTRDVIEDTFQTGGVLFRFIDTAGIRRTNDTIENLGIERTFQKTAQAQIILWMLDATKAEEQISRLSPDILPHCGGEKQLILVYNKTDLLPEFAPHVPPGFPLGTQSIAISARSGTHIEELRQLLVRTANLPSVSCTDVIVTNMHHYESLTCALDSIHHVQDGLHRHISGDFLAQDIRECIHHLGSIVGEVSEEDVLQNIFKHFCIGK